MNFAGSSQRKKTVGFSHLPVSVQTTKKQIGLATIYIE